MQEETIRGAEKYSRYRITVRVYNGAGDGPKSGDRYINTPEGSEQLNFNPCFVAYMVCQHRISGFKKIIIQSFFLIFPLNFVHL